MAPAPLRPAIALLLLLGPTLVEPAAPAPLRHTPALLLGSALMQPATTAPLRPTLQLGPALVQPAPRAARQLPVRGRLNAHTRANTKASADGLEFRRFLSRTAGLATQLVGPQELGAPAALLRLGALAGARANTVLSLFEASVGASSGGYDNPAALGTADSSEEVADLVV